MCIYNLLSKICLELNIFTLAARINAAVREVEKSLPRINKLKLGTYRSDLSYGLPDPSK